MPFPIGGALPSMSSRKEWLMFFRRLFSSLSFRSMRGRFCFLSGSGDQFPALSSLYGKALLLFTPYNLL